jgi:pimeloyl-ACP methyl ester carboxylesterase
MHTTHLWRRLPINVGLLIGVVWALCESPLLVLSKILCSCCYRPNTKQDVAIRILTEWRVNSSLASVLIRGHNNKLPPLLIIHGGPGSSSFPFYALSAGKLLEKFFCVCHYDQRSALKSGHRNHHDNSFFETVTIQQHVLDVICVAQQLCAKFKVQKVHLLGGSWGTILCLLAARDRPDLFSSVILRGLVVDTKRSEMLSTKYLLKRQHEIGLPYFSASDIERNRVHLTHPRRTSQQLLAQRMQLVAVGGTRYNISERKTPDSYWRSKANLIKAGLVCPELSVFEIMSGLENGRRTLHKLWPSIKNFISFQHIPKLDGVAKVLILHGRFDHCTSASLVEAWFEKFVVNNGQKKLVWFEKSGHSPQIEEKNRFVQEIVSYVFLPEESISSSRQCK